MSRELALVLHVLRLVLERLGSSGSEAVPVGGVYLVDRLKTQRYASLRRRTGRGRDQTLLTIRPRPRRQAIELQLPVPRVATERLAEAVLGVRVRTLGTKSAFDVTRNSRLDLLAGEIARLMSAKRSS